VLCAGVSLADPGAPLEHQVVPLAACAVEKRIRVVKAVAEMGSGRRGHG
jgi:hypothetical protein